jgi:serine/threonine-protein kinase
MLFKTVLTGLVFALAIPNFVLAGSLPEDTDVGLAAEAKEIFRSHCAECHTGDQARAGVDVLAHQDLIDNGYLTEKEPDDSVIYQLMTSTGEDVMPPSNRSALSADEIATIRKWIVAGAAAFPKDVELKNTELNKAEPKEAKSVVKVEPEEKPSPDDADTDPAKTIETPREVESAPPAFVQNPAQIEEEILSTILARVRKSTEAERPYLRFFSIRHLIAGGVTEQRIKEHRWALAKAVNSLSKEPLLVVPEAIDDVAGGTIFAVDIRKLGWHRVSVSNQQQRLNFYDLALLEYPYAVLPESSDAFDQLKREFLYDAKQVRPVPYVRADWFCSSILQPPLYHDFLEMPRTLEELETSIGVNVAENLDTSIAKRAGMSISGVSRNNRAVERHPHRNGYYWKSHDFSHNIAKGNILADPINFVPSGGEMFFTLPNGMQAYFVTDNHGNRLDAAPTEIVVDKFASDRVVRNGLGCIRCHNRGIKRFHDIVRSVVEQLPGSPGFDKRKALELYPEADEWKTIVQADEDAFLKAMATLGVDKRTTEPLSLVTNDFLENAINSTQAAAELGVSKDTLTGMCKSRGLVQLGLAPLAANSIIRRDALEANFDVAVRTLGLGIPVTAIDGNKFENSINDSICGNAVVRTNKKNNFFEPGDRMRVFVDNPTNETLHIELYGTSVDGQKVCLTGGQIPLQPGKTFAFPANGEPGIQIQPAVGKETITLYASDRQFPAGQILSGQHIDDRVVHGFFDYYDGKTIADDTQNLIKRTITIETR